jgi:antirestriction protein ArdC
LVAELGAAFLCAELGITPEMRKTTPLILAIG